MRFLRLFCLFFFILNSHLSFGQEKHSVTENNPIENPSKKQIAGKETKIVLNNEKNIAEVKKNLLFLLFIIILFVFGLILLIYYSKKIKIANHQLEIYSKENAFLLNEAHHRINNNLQIIISLISSELIKPENHDNPSLEKILTKIESISTLHRHLYQSEDKKKVSLKKYLEEIVLNYKDICNEKNIKTDVNLSDSLVSNNDAMYFGLLVTELFINSIKYAFQDLDQKTISLTINTQSNTIELLFADNGNLEKNIIVEPKLVINLAKQLKSDYTINTENGFMFKLTKRSN